MQDFTPLETLLINLQQDETKKKKEESKEQPKPEPKPFKMQKSSVKKEVAPEPEPEPEPAFKLTKKKTSRQIPKEEPKEEENPFGMKLKKTETVKRTWDDPSMEKVDLKHHEFERAPQDVEVQAFRV